MGVIFLQNPIDGKMATHHVLVKMMLAKAEIHET